MQLKLKRQCGYAAPGGGGRLKLYRMRWTLAWRWEELA